MNIFRALAVTDLDEATRAIPVTDFAHVFQGEPGGLYVVAARVRHACETVGFFYLAGHGVPDEIVDAALAASREFHAPPVIADTFLVNLGNIMKRWSNDRFLSTPHGVLNDSGTDRYSIAFFYSPTVSARIECVPTCVSVGNPPRYEPAVYRDLVLDFYNANYFHRQQYAGGKT